MDAGTSISLRTDVLEKLKNALNDSSYRETIESSSNYNNRLVVERKTRIPFIDSQTGVAQNDCYLWMQKWERMPPVTEGQLYSYPKKRWRKKKRSQYLLNNNYGLNVKQWEKNPDKTNLDLNLMNGHETSNDSNLIGFKGIDVAHHEHTTDKFFDNVSHHKDDWMNELDDVNDFNDTIDIDDNESDYDDEEYSSKKKKKKKNENATNSNKKGKKGQSSSDQNSTDNKRFSCDLCGMKYKTRPGLSYHYSHTHSVEVGERKHLVLDDEDSQQSNSSSLTGGANGLNSRSSQISNSTSNSPLPPNSLNQTNLTSKTSSVTTNNLPSASPVFNNKNDKSKNKKPPTTPSSYCDFCLGNSEINKKTRTSEEMISCHHCGRSAHPTCLQFTPNMIKSVKKYPWECLECKSCGICGTSDNDDQLLFCDDCDRGYHSHCVGLKEIPEGEWSCEICLEEYHKPEPITGPLNNNSNNSTLASTNSITSMTNTSTITSSSTLNNNSKNLEALLNTNNDSLANNSSTTNNNNKSTVTTNSHLKSQPQPSLTTSKENSSISEKS